MERRNDDLLDRWLKAEDGGSDTDADAADAALTALFAALPLALAPAPGFADRVLAAMPAMPAVPATPATPAEPRPAVRAHVLSLLYGFMASPWGRASVALGLAGAALTFPV